MNSWFRYNVVRVWQQPVDDLVAAGLPILPLAPMSNVEADKLPAVLLTISPRTNRRNDASPSEDVAEMPPSFFTVATNAATV